MPNVKFLKGHSSNLSKNPLDNGTIYFTPDTRRLYIDTNSARVPITGDTMCGKIFWVCLPIGSWNAEDKKIQITEWYEQQNDTTSYDLTDVLSNDSIIFVGQTDKLGEYTYIICKNYSDGTMIFEYTGDNFEAITDDVWVQIYTPNPKIQSYIPLEDFPKSVYTAREYLIADGWSKETNDSGEETGRYYQELIVDELNLDIFPFMINLSDDSLENIYDYIDISDMSVKYEKIDENWGRSIITFYSNESFNFNVAIDLVVVINEDNNYHTELMLVLSDYNEDNINRDDLPTELQKTLYQIFIPTFLKKVEENENREFVIYASNFSDEIESIEYYNSIINIEYVDSEEDKTGFIITFSKKIGEIEKTSSAGFSLTIIQLNNISTIHEITLAANNWDEKETTQNSAITGQKERYYVQMVTSNKGSITGKHLPLVYPINEKYSQAFSKIIETKVYNGKMLFYTKELPTKDIKVKIIDFI